MRNQLKISSLLVALAASILTAGCGGGGGTAAGGTGGTSGRGTSGSGSISLLAGDIGSYGNIDGAGTAARFASPQALAIDGTGNLYLSDSNNSTVRKITPAGLVTTLAGVSGAAGLALDGAGNLYEADDRDLVILKVAPSGNVTTLAGTKDVYGSADGSGAAASFSGPSSIAVDSAGNVYVGDSGNDAIRKITPGGVVTTLASPLTPYQPGNGFISGLAVDGAGNVYEAEIYIVITVIDPSGGSGGNAIVGSVIRKITPAGVVTVLAGSSTAVGAADGIGAAASFDGLAGLTIDASGNLYATDANYGSVRKITPAGVVTTLAGTAFLQPIGVAVDAAGNLFVSDSNYDTVSKISSSGAVTVIAGATTVVGSADGTGSAAGFTQPRGLTVDSSGNVYVADYTSGAIRKITPAGVVTTVASGGTLATSLGGYDLAVDASGNLYMPTLNDVFNVISPAGVVTTLAGMPGVASSVDGSGSGAGFNYPTGVILDSANNAYVADSGNGTIRKVTQAGVVTTVAGVAGTHGSADGSSTTATFGSPQALALDGSGNLYVLDSSNNNIRKITPSGTVSTLAGTAGSTGYVDGTGPAARFNHPVAMAIDAGGNLFVADSYNNAIRKITPAGVVSTVVGQAGSTGIALGSLPGSLFVPLGVAFDSKGVLYVSSSNAVLKVSLQ